MRAFSVWIFNGQQKRRLVLTGWEDSHFVRQLYGLYVLLFTAGFYLVFDQYPEILVICIDLIYMCQTGENMKVVTVVGARPQFIKAAVVSHELRKNTGRFSSIRDSIMMITCQGSFSGNWICRKPIIIWAFPAALMP